MHLLNRLLLALPLLVLFPLAGCDSSGSKASSGSGGGSGGGGSSKGLTKILVISDSLGTGYGIATPYTEFLRAEVGVPLVNNSQKSRQTATGIQLAGSLIPQENPSHLIVLLGTNDALRGSVPNAIANLQRIADIANNAGVTVIMGTLPPITESASQDAKAAQISDGIRGIRGVRVADVRKELPRSEIADGVHPSTNGQRIIAMVFKERL